jgi:hypothetical protein
MHAGWIKVYRSDQGGRMMAASDLVGSCPDAKGMVITRQSLSNEPVTTAVIKRRTNARFLRSVKDGEATEKWLPQSAPATTLVFSNKCPWRIGNVGLRHARISPATKPLGPETSVPQKFAFAARDPSFSGTENRGVPLETPIASLNAS